MSAEKEKGEGLKPSQRAEREPGERGTLSRKRGGTREETISRSEDSISFEKEKIKRVCENLLEYAAACRYGLSRGERYVPLPMCESDAEAFEMAARMLTALLEGAETARETKKPKLRKGEPVGEFRSYAKEVGCEELYQALGAFEEMRNKKRLPLTDVARHRVICKLKQLSTDPLMQAKVLMQSVDNAWTGLYALKGEDKPKTESSFDTDEFFKAALAHSQRLYERSHEGT